MKVRKKASIAETDPKLASQWHPRKNKRRQAKDFDSKSQSRVWWVCPVDKSHEWQAAIYVRAEGKRLGCPFCAEIQVNSSNSLESRYSRIAKLWHRSKNDWRTPKNILASSSDVYWWQCAKDKSHEWRDTIEGMQTVRKKCLFCVGGVSAKSKSLQELHPELAADWHETKKAS